MNVPAAVDNDDDGDDHEDHDIFCLRNRAELVVVGFEGMMFCWTYVQGPSTHSCTSENPQLTSIC